VHNLSEMEQIEYQACEAVLMMSSRSFVDAGQALGRIRDLRLYREEFNTFEEYCRAKWEYGRVYAHYLIAAAQLFTHLLSNCEHRKPDHESQLRPLAALPPEQAQLAWESAVQEAGGRRITAARVKAAIKQLGLAPATPPVSKITRQKKAEQRRQLDEAIGQLLVLTSQKAGYDLLAKQVEALHGHIQACSQRRPSISPADQRRSLWDTQIAKNTRAQRLNPWARITRKLCTNLNRLKLPLSLEP